MTTHQPAALPELPKPAHRGPTGTGTYFDSYTADQMRAYALAALQSQPAAAGVSDDDLRAMWRQHGGMFHGPLIETGTMPEAKLLAFLRAILRPQAVPMTDEQRQQAFNNSWATSADFFAGIVAAEAHYFGITAQGAQGVQG